MKNFKKITKKELKQRHTVKIGHEYKRHILKLLYKLKKRDGAYTIAIKKIESMKPRRDILQAYYRNFRKALDVVNKKKEGPVFHNMDNVINFKKETGRSMSNWERNQVDRAREQGVKLNDAQEVVGFLEAKRHERRIA